MAQSQKHLLTQSATNPAMSARAKYEQGVLPTLLEVRVGSPGQIKGITLQSQSLKNFAETAKGSIKEIGSTHWRVMDDHTLTEAAKLVRSATNAEQKIKLARQQFGRLAEGALDQITRLQKELKSTTKPPASVGDALVDGELRALIRAEKDASKQLAMVRSDPAMLGAAARAPAALSGLAADVHANIQTEHMKASDPETYEIYEDLQAAFNCADQALRAIEGQATALIDFDTARELGARQVINI